MNMKSINFSVGIAFMAMVIVLGTILITSRVSEIDIPEPSEHTKEVTVQDTTEISPSRYELIHIMRKNHPTSPIPQLVHNAMEDNVIRKYEYEKIGDVIDSIITEAEQLQLKKIKLNLKGK